MQLINLLSFLVFLVCLRVFFARFCCVFCMIWRDARNQFIEFSCFLQLFQWFLPVSVVFLCDLVRCNEPIY